MLFLKVIAVRTSSAIPLLPYILQQVQQQPNAPYQNTSVIGYTRALYPFSRATFICFVLSSQCPTDAAVFFVADQ